MDRHERAHYRRVEAHVEAVRRILDAAAGRAARAAELYGGLDAEGHFSFSARPALQRALSRVLGAARRDVFAYLAGAVWQEWGAAEEAADELARGYCRAVGLPDAAAAERGWLARAEAARVAFAGRRVGGLDLSARVWRLVEGLGAELEVAVEGALAEGRPSAGLAGEVKRYLREPNRLYRRVRGRDGTLRASRPARAYHPGAGVYRSSYMNARRLTVTETNMAYRAADHARWARMDFVVGIEVRLSHNHTCKGVKGRFYDVCDELAGRYPKDFKFVGWHPHCRCHAVPILRALEGAAGVEAPVGEEVRELPRAFYAWVGRNEARLQALRARGRLPYFITDNFEATAAGLRRRGALVAFGGTVAAARAAYDGLLRAGWGPLCFSEASGGYAVVHPARARRGEQNKQERAKLAKEQRMCGVFAAAGYRVEMLEERPGVASPDVRINGRLADLKSVSSAKQIARRAKRAVRGQGAELVLFEFGTRSETHEEEMDKLRRGGFHGLYYYLGDKRIREF